LSRYKYLSRLADEQQIRPFIGPGVEYGRQYPTVACVNCWRDVVRTDFALDDIAADPRGFFVFTDDQFYIHRRAMIDNHVIGAVCGNLYSHPGLTATFTGAASVEARDSQ
jgi:hypothetical protein